MTVGLHLLNVEDCRYKRPEGEGDCDVEGEGEGEDRKKRARTAFTAHQIKLLEAEFEKNKYLSVSKRLQLSKTLMLTETQVSSYKAVTVKT